MLVAVSLLSVPTAAPLVRALARRGDAPAVLTAELSLTYGELAVRVAEVARRLGPARRLVLLEGASTVEGLTAYLGALAARCPVLLVPPGDTAVAAAYDPDVVLRTAPGEVLLDERREASAHELHPDLALLLSTSGSSGSPKLVRLSYDNLLANAGQVADALGVRPDDRAMTSLPLHYCYGLSVLHSHLLRGAAVVLTELSVVDACFWDLFRRTGATTFAGVPYTFDLLERVGFDGADVPTLRYVTQAGGRLAPERVRAWAETGARNGWDLVVMYGQTEATARMAVLPPRLALTRPEAVGVPVPGGRIDVDAPAGEVGELVYRGANVMLGYAETAADLALGRTVAELRTGDLARVAPDGLVEVVGRRSRTAKVFGLRLDLGHVEARLAEDGVRAACEGLDDLLGVVVESGQPPAAVQALVRRATGLPRHAVRVAAVDALPRTPSGKVDHPAAARLLTVPAPAPAATRVRDVLADVLGVPVGDDDTFVGLGGDSLSYVEVSVRLEEVLPTVPAGWHLLPVRELEAGAVGARPRRRTLDTTVALRAAAIVLIVGSHADLFTLMGGAHVLVAVAGWNFARFHLGTARRERTRSLLRSTARIALPACAWIGATAAVTGAYDLSTVLLLNDVLGPDRWDRQWSFWFVETLVQVLLVLGLLLAVPAVDRLERRGRFAFAAGLVAAGLAVRYDLVPVPTDVYGRFAPTAVLWLFALGWAAAVATRPWQRLLVAATAVAALPGYFVGDGSREGVVAAGLLLLVGVARVPSSRLVNRVAGVLAGASLYVYVTHWQVYPHLEDRSPLLAVLASFAVGLAYWGAVRQVTARWSALRRR